MLLSHPAIPECVRTNNGYHERICKLARAATRRIYLETMSFDGYGAMAPVVDELINASQRGVDVRLTLDRFSYPDMYLKRGQEGITELKDSLHRLGQAAVGITILGQLRPNIFAGRHHIKSYIFDDTTLTAGGANLTADTIRHADFMLEYHDPDLADRLCQHLQQNHGNRHTDTTVAYNEHNTFLFDAGRPGQSQILDASQSMLRGGTRAWYVSKMLPHPALAASLQAVPDVQAYFMGPHRGGKLNRLASWCDAHTVQLANSHTGNGRIHAKFCVVEYPDGQRAALTGSHNFNARGVRWGASELALLTTEQSVCNMLVDFAEQLPDS